MTKKCKYCGKEYETDLYWWTFCSDECYQAYRYQKDTYLRKCEICGELYHPIRGNQKYCSPKCREIAKRNNEHQYYLNHKEEIKNRTSQYSKDHPEVFRKSSKKYTSTHKEYYARKSREYYWRNRDKIRKRKKEQRNYKMDWCKKKHNGCFDCPEEVGYCPYD